MLLRTLFASAGILCAAALPAAGDASFRDFRNTTGLNLIGQAAVSGRSLRLVPSLRNSRGDAWTQSPFEVSHGFCAAFTFRYSHQGGARDGNGNPGNDGLFFVIQPVSNALPLNIDMPRKSLSLYFDGWKNYDRDDVSSSRLEVAVDGMRLSQVDLEPLGVRYRDSKPVRVKVEYDGSDLTVLVNSKQAACYTNLSIGGSSPAYVGFHGMGGDAYADVDILSFRFDSGCHPIAAAHLREWPANLVWN